MFVDWDPIKARSNFSKHGIRFADAVDVLGDDNALTVRDERSEEERWVSIGMDSLARMLLVVYTWRGDRIRLISARPATSSEIRQYEAGL